MNLAQRPSGLGLIEGCIVDALFELGALSSAPFVKSRRVLDHANATIGLAPSAAYQRVCDLARPDVTHLSPIEFHGNHGSNDFGPADSEYTEVRLSLLGEAAARAQRGEGPALPLALINGDFSGDGRRPPFDPKAMVAGIRAAAAGCDDQTLLATVGRPSFAEQCDVDGDVDGLLNGERTRLWLRSRLDVSTPGELVITALPPGVSADEVGRAAMGRAMAESVAYVNDDSADGRTRLVLVLQDGVDPVATAQTLLAKWGVSVERRVDLGGPLVDLVRGWLDGKNATDVESAVQIVEAAIERSER